MESIDEKPKKRKRKKKEDIFDDEIFQESKYKTAKEDCNETIIEELENSGLKQNQQDFLLYYLECHNASQAYLKAYPSCKKKLAGIKGYLLLRQENIKNTLAKLKKIMIQAYDIDPSKYIETQLKIANADIGDYIKFSEEEIPLYNEDGTIMFDPDTGEQMKKKVNRMHLVDSETVDTSVIVSVKQGRDGITIQLMDKMKAWENIKNFFEWKHKKEDRDILENNIIDAINNSTNEVWDEKTAYEDLDNMLKEEK